MLEGFLKGLDEKGLIQSKSLSASVHPTEVPPRQLLLAFWVRLLQTSAFATWSGEGHAQLVRLQSLSTALVLLRVFPRFVPDLPRTMPPDVEGFRDDAVRSVVPQTARAFCPTCAMLTHWTPWWRTPHKWTGSPSNSAMSLGARASALFDWNPDLLRTALQHHLRIPFLPSMRSAPCAAKSLPSSGTTRCAYAQGTATGDTTPWPTFSTKRSKKRREGRLRSPTAPQPRPPRRRVNPQGEDSTPESLGSLRSPLPSPSFQPGQLTACLQNMTEDETLTRTFHDTAARCCRNCICFSFRRPRQRVR